MSPRKQSPAAPEKTVAHFGIRMPLFKTYLWTAAVSTNMPRENRAGVSRSTLAVIWTGTPCRFRLAGPRRQWVDLDAGNAVVIPAYSRFWIDRRPHKGPGHQMWANFLWMSGTPLDDMTKNRLGIARIEDPDGAMKAAFDRLIDVVQASQDDTDGSFWALQYTGQKLARMIEVARPAGEGLYRVAPDADLQPDPLVARVMTYLRHHMAESFSLEDIARSIHASRSTVAHRYKASTGEAPMQTLRRIRIQEVKALLVNDVPLKQIAELTGFCDTRHLAREFRRAEGLCTSQFLKAIRR